MLECMVVFRRPFGSAEQAVGRGRHVSKLYGGVAGGCLGSPHVENTGQAFGVLGKSTLVLTVVSALAMVVLCFVLVKFRKELSKFGRVGLALIIAGGLGNLIDRVFRLCGGFHQSGIHAICRV